MAEPNTTPIFNDEEKKSLLRKIWEAIQKFKERHAPSVYEAVKKCEETLEELGEAQNISTEVLRSLVDITSDLESRMHNIAPDEMAKELEHLQSLFESVKKSAEHSTVTVTAADLEEAVKDAFYDTSIAGSKGLGGEKEVFMSPDNKVFIKVGNRYAEAMLLKTDDTLNEMDDVFISRVNLSQDKISELIPMEKSDDESIEDVLLKAVCKANDMIYEADVLEKLRLEKRIESGNLLMDIVKKANTPYTSKDGNTECVFLRSDSSFRVRDKNTKDMLVFTPKNGELEVRLCRDCSSFDSDAKSAVVGNWKNVENGGIKGHITDFSDSVIEALMQSEFSGAYLAYVAGLSKEKLETAFAAKEEKITSKVNSGGMEKTEQMYEKIADLIKDKEGYYIQKLSSRKDNTVSLSIRVPNVWGNYYLNFTKDGEIKNHVFRSDENRKSEIVLTGNNVVVNPRLAQEKEFGDYLAIVKQAEQAVEKTNKPQEKAERRKGIEKE